MVSTGNLYAGARITLKPVDAGLVNSVLETQPRGYPLRGVVALVIEIPEGR